MRLAAAEERKLRTPWDIVPHDLLDPLANELSLGHAAAARNRRESAL